MDAATVKPHQAHRTPRRALLPVVVALAVAAGAGLVVSLAAGAPAAAVLLLAIVAALCGVLLAIVVRLPGQESDAPRAREILAITDESLSHLRRGLSEETAGDVCAILLAHTDTAAVAITGTRTILGFVGMGADHHLPGHEILTGATREVLSSDVQRVVASPEEINCSQQGCPLRTAVVVPLHVSGSAVGTLKFYFTRRGRPDETDIAIAQGLARLLSTQLELSELERQTQLACEMELKALQAQINPHFLFNSINTIASLIRTDAPQARDLLRDFAAFYRQTLETDDRLIPLSKEMEYVRSYFRLERARFGERVELNVELDPRHQRLLVPAFVVQPLVENAVRHGMPPEGCLRITIGAVAHGDVVEVRVRDDGLGMDASRLAEALPDGHGVGIGLRNVDERLRGHFGPESGLRVKSAPGAGTTVSLVVRRSART